MLSLETQKMRYNPGILMMISLFAGLFILGIPIMAQEDNTLSANSDVTSDLTDQAREGEYVLYPEVLSGGGGESSSANYTINSTLAQPSAIGISTSTDYTLSAGYWAQITGILANNLKGVVTLERPGVTAPDASYRVLLTISLCDSGSVLETYQTRTDESGHFSVTTEPGTFDILVRSNHTLATRTDDIVIPASGTTSEIDFGTLREGDADQDNLVLSSDFFLLRASYNTGFGDPSFNAQTDFNDDEIVTSTDFFLLRNNYNTAGDDCTE